MNATDRSRQSVLDDEIACIGDFTELKIYNRGRAALWPDCLTFYFIDEPVLHTLHHRRVSILRTTL
jgi:hypothetical protein